MTFKEKNLKLGEAILSKYPTLAPEAKKVILKMRELFIGAPIFDKDAEPIETYFEKVIQGYKASEQQSY